MSRNSQSKQKKLVLSNIDYYFVYWCIILSLATNGLGNFFFGTTLPLDISTIFIFIAITFQVVTFKLRFPKVLLIVYLYIIIQTFLLNFLYIDFTSSFRHLVALLIFSISIFSFVSVNRARLFDIIGIYYRFCLVIASIAILQTVLYVCFGISFIPQNFISGTTIAGRSNVLYPEIFGIIPRAIGLSTEPAHYSILVLPGIYIALLEIIGKPIGINFQNKFMAYVMIIGFILSFSIVGYFGLLLCLLSINSNALRLKFATKVGLVIFFMLAVYVISQTELMAKITTIPKMLQGISEYSYTVNDSTAFALVSNLLVAGEGLAKSNYLGTGFNTHKDTYAATIYKLFNTNQVVIELNSADAGSMFIRILSEFGLPGILMFVILLFHYKLKREKTKTRLGSLNSLCLVMLLSYCSRNGGYISCYCILFAAIYYYSYLLGRNVMLTTEVKYI